MADIASFAKTGNIEMRKGRSKVLLGQYAYGEFRIKEQYRLDIKAQKRIAECASIVTAYGRPEPPIVYYV